MSTVYQHAAPVPQIGGRRVARGRASRLTLPGLRRVLSVRHAGIPDEGIAAEVAGGVVELVLDVRQLVFGNWATRSLRAVAALQLPQSRAAADRSPPLRCDIICV